MKIKAQKNMNYGRKLELVDVPLHEAAVDGIVIATDSNYSLDGLAAKTLHRVLGSKLQAVVDDAVKTRGKLSRASEAVVQKVGGITSPIIILCNVQEGSRDSLKNSVRNSLDIAANAGLKSVGIPNMGRDDSATECAQVIEGIISFHFASPKSSVKEFVLLPLDDDRLYGYMGEMAKLE